MATPCGVVSRWAVFALVSAALTLRASADPDPSTTGGDSSGAYSPPPAGESTPSASGASPTGQPVGSDNSIYPKPYSPSVSGNSTTPDNSTDADSNSDSQVPTSVVPTNPNVPIVPLLPQQGYTGSLPTGLPLNQTQTPQLETPSLYNGNVMDLSQVATNAALTQAFSQGPGGAGFVGDQPGGSYSHPPIDRLRLGPFDLRATVAVNVVNDDNLRPDNSNDNNGANDNGSKVGDTYFTLTPAVLLIYGDHEGQKGYASLVYSPTIQRFLKLTSQDTENQNVAFNAVYPLQRVTLDFSQTFAQSSQYNQDVNSRTNQSSSVTTAGLNYDIDARFGFSSQVQEQVTSFSNGQGQGETITSLNNSLTYHLSDKINVGPSINVGVDKPQGSSDQDYEQGLLGITYQPTAKISANAQAGLEIRQYKNAGDSTSPVFSLGVGYVPFDSTGISLSASQSVNSSSADSSETVMGTTVGVSVTQRLFQRVYLGASVNYEHDDYGKGNGPGNPGAVSTSGPVPNSDTEDDSIVYRPSISFSPTTWTSLAVYYQYQDETSNQAGRGSHDNQLGFSASAQF